MLMMVILIWLTLVAIGACVIVIGAAILKELHLQSDLTLQQLNTLADIDRTLTEAVKLDAIEKGII